MAGTKDSELYEWSRHYDNLLWIVSTIMMAAIGGLFLYVRDHPDPFLTLFGLFLTGAALWFAASFRELRHGIEKKYGSWMKNILKRRNYYQWHLYVIIFWAIGGFWLGPLANLGFVQHLFKQINAVYLVLLLLWSGLVYCKFSICPVFSAT